MHCCSANVKFKTNYVISEMWSCGCMRINCNLRFQTQCLQNVHTVLYSSNDIQFTDMLLVTWRIELVVYTGQGNTNAFPLARQAMTCTYFTNIGQRCASKIERAPTHFSNYLIGNHKDSPFLSPITPADILTIISNLKSKASSGQIG